MERARHINHWTSQEVDALRQLAKENTPARVIASKLRRSQTSIYRKAQREGISLKPTNQSPHR
jgi:IS30 family transposase